MSDEAAADLITEIFEKQTTLLKDILGLATPDLTPETFDKISTRLYQADADMGLVVIQMNVILKNMEKKT
jgi:hypothetical protein